DATRRLREAREWRDLPVIALTANALQEDRERCMAAGMNDFMSKPFDTDRLRDMLIAHLPDDRCEVRSAPAARPQPGSAQALDPASAKVAAGSKMINLEHLEKLRKLQRPGRPDVVARVVQIYLDQTPLAVQAIRDALAASDATAVQLNAHMLKSSCANVGALRLPGLFAEIEALARDNDLAAAGSAFETAERLNAELTDALQDLIADGPPGRQHLSTR
ncbi:MAG: response regulator, partial [Gammaproteobacteria bacterium]|nr:response regulator [Gammaproteobacteria bacterium]